MTVCHPVQPEEYRFFSVELILVYRQNVLTCLKTGRDNLQYQTLADDALRWIPGFWHIQ